MVLLHVVQAVCAAGQMPGEANRARMVTRVRPSCSSKVTGASKMLDRSPGTKEVTETRSA